MDPCVEGHVINALYRMKARGHSGAVERSAGSPIAWIRNAARRYLAWDRWRSGVLGPG